MAQFTFNGKTYDSTQYAVKYEGTTKVLVDRKTNRIVEEAQPQKQVQNNETTQSTGSNSNTSSIAKNIAQTAGSALKNAVTAQSINDPQTGHYQRQAVLSEAQAARSRADEQAARQEAYRNTGDRALTESAKIAEASSAANIRNNQKAMSAEMGGAAATMAAAKNAAVDPMQNAMSLKQAGYNRQDRATQLGQTATSNQTAAEAQRAQATQSRELLKEKEQYNAQANRLAKAEEERHSAELDELRSRARLNEAQANKNVAEEKAVATETDKQSYEQSQQYSDAIDTLLQSMQPEKADINKLYTAYVKVPNLSDSNAALGKIASYLGKNSPKAQEFYNRWKLFNTKEGWAASPTLKNRNYEQADTAMQNVLLSDERLKIKNTPVGKTLLHAYAGRS